MSSDALVLSEVAMLNDLAQLRAISQNLANANTAGYKRDVAVTRSFDELLLLAGPDAAPDLQAVISGRPRPTVKVATDLSQGALQRTGAALDVAIESPDHYFELLSSAGAFYTRQGRFTLDAGGRLVTGSGLAVSGVDGEIRLTGQAPRIDKQGRVWENEEQVAQLKLVRIIDAGGFTKVGSGLFFGGIPVSADPDAAPGLRQGYVEASNVVLMDEMVRMIETMRHFEASQRVARGYDEMIDTAVRTIAEF